MHGARQAEAELSGALARLSITNRVTRFSPMIFNDDQLAIRGSCPPLRAREAGAPVPGAGQIGRARPLAHSRDGRTRPDGGRSAGVRRRAWGARRHRGRHCRGTRVRGLQRQRRTGRRVAARRDHHEQRVAEAGGVLDSSDDQRRDIDGRVRDGAQRRLRRERHEAALPPRRRLLCSRRRENLDHLRRLC